MGIIGNVICERRHLRLAAGEAPQVELLYALVLLDRVREAVLAITADRDAGAIGQWAVVLEEPFERFPGEIEPVEGRVAALEHGHSPQRLRVVIKAARSGEAAVERALAGMAEWRMPQIVP